MGHHAKRRAVEVTTRRQLTIARAGSGLGQATGADEVARLPSFTCTVVEVPDRL